MEGNTGYIEIPNFLKNPIAYFKANKIRRLQEESISQEEFFFFLDKCITGSSNSNFNGPHHDSILFFGYDKEFMNYKSTIEALTTSIKQRKDNFSLQGYPIEMIVSESDDISGMKEFMEEKIFFKVAKTKKEIKRGFIVYGGIGVSTWDSEKKTYYPKESNDVIYRDMDVNPRLALRAAEVFCERKYNILYRNL